MINKAVDFSNCIQCLCVMYIVVPCLFNFILEFFESDHFQDWFFGFLTFLTSGKAIAFNVCSLGKTKRIEELFQLSSNLNPILKHLRGDKSKSFRHNSIFLRISNNKSFISKKTLSFCRPRQQTNYLRFTEAYQLKVQPKIKADLQ